MASAQEIKDAATAAATAAVTAALAGIQAQQPQVVVQKQLVMPAFDISSDLLAQGLDFLDYVEQFEFACASANIKEAVDMKNNFLTSGGKAIRDINASIADSEVEGDNEYKKLLNKCKKRFISTDQAEIARANFFSARRSSSENEIEFFLRLKKLQGYCNFSDLNANQKDSLLRDILLANCGNSKIQTYCWTHKTNLKDTLVYMSTTLNIQAQSKRINKTSEASVNQINSNSRGFNNSGSRKCPNCLLDARHRVCFAKGKDCKKCGKIGHFARACRQGKPPPSPGSSSSGYQTTGNRFTRPQQFQRGGRQFARQINSDNKFDDVETDLNQDASHDDPNATLAHPDQFANDVSASFSRHISLSDNI